MTSEPLSLEEKVDKILKYQTRIYRWQVAKFIIGLLIFVILVVIPIVWFAMWIKSVDFAGITEAYQGIQNASGEITNLSNFLNNIK